MKNLSTLVFVFFCLLSYGQKALTASILLQNSGQHLGNDELINGQLITRYYNTAQIPTAALAYMHFGHLGGYVRWQLSGWRYQRIVDEVSSLDLTTGLYAVSQGVTTHLAGGRIGFGRGIQLRWSGKNRFLLEFAVSAAWRYAKYNPFTPTVFPRTIFTTATQVGPNLVYHRVFERGFIRVAGLLPIFQFKTEYYRINDPRLPAATQKQTSSYVSGDGWSNAGVEVGAGFYFSDK